MNKTTREQAIEKAVSIEDVRLFIKEARELADSIEAILSDKVMPILNKKVNIFDELVRFGLSSESELKFVA